MISMQRDIMGKVDNMQEQMRNERSKNSKKNQKKMIKYEETL